MAALSSPSYAAVAENWVGKHPATVIDGDTLFGIWTPVGGSGCDNIPISVIRGIFGNVESPAPRTFTVYNCESLNCLTGGRSNSGAFLVEFDRSSSMMYFANNITAGVQYCAMSYWGRYMEGKGWTCYLAPANRVKFNEMSSAATAQLLKATYHAFDENPRAKPTGLQPWPPSYTIGC